MVSFYGGGSSAGNRVQKASRRRAAVNSDASVLTRLRGSQRLFGTDGETRRCGEADSEGAGEGRREGGAVKKM